MRKWVSGLVSLAVVLVLAVPAAASAATTIGTTTQPTGSSPNACGSGSVIAQFTSDPSTPYSVPSGGGLITSWSINTEGDTTGLGVTLVVLRPAGDGNFVVVGTDSETIPSPLPSGNIATYALSAPISVAEGDTLGLWTNNDTGVACYWDGGSTPASDSLIGFDASTPPTTGEALGSFATSGPGFTMNVSATLGPDVQDAGVTTSVAPDDGVVGYPELLSSMVSNGGLGASPITFIDHVPSGFTISLVVTASGTCSRSGQFVFCTMIGLTAGKSGTVDIVATPTSSGTYTNAVAVAVSSGTDPNPANDNASAALSVRSAASAVPTCVVPKLKGTPVRAAKHLLHALDCTVGKVGHRHSKAIRKGNVIGTAPEAGTYASGEVVRIQVSSGRKKTKEGRRR